MSYGTAQRQLEARTRVACLHYGEIVSVHVHE